MKALETESRCSRPGAGPVTVCLTVMVLLTVFSHPLYPAVKLSPPVVVQGEQWALYDVSSVKGAPYCMPYENSGYSLEIQGVDPVSRRVMVHSRQGDLDSRAVFPPQPGSIPTEAAVYAASSGAVPDLTALARSLTRSCRTQYQAVNRVLCWVSGAIDYRTGPGVPVKPREVWRQGAGNCVGASELAVALLREVGIPARGVRGFLAPGSVTGATTSIESRLVQWTAEKAELESCHQRLRLGDPALVGRMNQDGLAVDVRTITDEEIPLVVAAFRAAWSGSPSEAGD